MSKAAKYQLYLPIPVFWVYSLFLGDGAHGRKKTRIWHLIDHQTVSHIAPQ